VGEKHIFWRSVTPYQGVGPSALQFMGFPSIYAYTLRRTTTKSAVVTHVGRACFQGNSHARDQKMWTVETQHSQFSGSSIYALPFNTSNDHLRQGNTWGACFLVSHASHPKEVGTSAPQILGVAFYLRVHPLTQNKQI